MEDEKKKKKNKKKKNKQTKTAGGVTNGVGEPSNTDQNHAIELDHRDHVLEIPNVQNEVRKADVDLDNHGFNGSKGTCLEETINTLQQENDAHTERQVFLQETNTGSEIENGTHIQKEDIWEENIKRLQDENIIHLHKEASLEMKLLQLQNEKDAWLQKQADYDEKINQIQADYDEKINLLIDKTDSLSSKEASLEQQVKQLERERDFKFEKENADKETIASLNANVTILQTQVLELKESGDYLLHENQRLAESISTLQLKIQNLEKSTASASTSSVMEAVDELHIEPVPWGIATNAFPAAGSELVAETAEKLGNADRISEFVEMTSAYCDRMDTPKDILIKDERGSGESGCDLNGKDTAHVTNSLSEMRERTSLPDKLIEPLKDIAFKTEGEDSKLIRAKDTIVNSNSPYTNETEEIVQIPLDENQVVGPALQRRYNDEKTDVPLTDSPLVGAPFRLISFVARYVSGSDLVNKN